MARRYEMRTTWLLDAPRARVAAVVRDYERWPAWWPGLEHVELLGGGRRAQRWRSPLAYRVTFVAVLEREGDELIEGVALGTLAGAGRCTLADAAGGGTRVEFELEVVVTPAWMRALAPLARPAFAWGHRALMRRGGEGIARVLGGRLLDVSHG
jgi:uncharacterized membrane protein